MSQPTKPAKRGRRTVARHGKLTSPHPVSQILKVLAVAVTVVLVSAGGVAAYTAIDFASSVKANAVNLDGQDAVPPDIGEIEGGVNLLLVGTDECEPELAQYMGDRCSGPDSEGTLNDVNILLHISDTPRHVTVISFPRDLMIKIPSCQREDGLTSSAMSKQQLNSAYSYGGLNCVVKTISQLSGLNIPFAAKVSFGNVIQITDAIGGVDVCVAPGTRILDSFTGLDLNEGTHTISGITALQFLRTRHGVGDGGDLGRISNQQQYMSNLAKKLVSENVLSNPTTLFKLATTAVHNIKPSQTLANPLTLVQIALAVKSVPFAQMVFLQYPTGTDPDDPNRVVPNMSAAEALWAALATNQPLELTGKASQGDGVVVQPDAGTPAPEPTPSATPTPGETTPPVTAAPPVVLPDSIAGTTAAQQTCSNGNARSTG